MDSEDAGCCGDDEGQRGDRAQAGDRDIIVCPTAAFPATPHGTWKLGGIYREYSHTSAYNLTGWPGGVVRAGTSPEGLPINVQIVARPWREDVVLAVLAHVEERFGGWVMPAV